MNLLARFFSIVYLFFACLAIIGIFMRMNTHPGDHLIGLGFGAIIFALLSYWLFYVNFNKNKHDNMQETKKQVEKHLERLVRENSNKQQALEQLRQIVRFEGLPRYRYARGKPTLIEIHIKGFVIVLTIQDGTVTDAKTF